MYTKNRARRHRVARGVTVKFSEFEIFSPYISLFWIIYTKNRARRHRVARGVTVSVVCGLFNDAVSNSLYAVGCLNNYE